MYIQHPAPRIYVNWTEDGRGKGVFASEDIAQGELIEICPALVFSKEDTKALDKTLIYEYYFLWENGKEETAILMGFGSFYNHDAQPNAETQTDFEDLVMLFVAIKDIKAGDEICIKYNEASELWFKEIRK